VDGSQAVPHRQVDVAAIGCDFYAFTGHKMLGPTGTGGLWAKREHLQAMPPFLGGGEMIREVRFEHTVFNDPPHKFEAGTPNIAGVIGLGAAGRTTCRRSAWSASRRASASCCCARPPRSTASTACASSGARATRPR
jgi:selenocysteine lyase/cysteine desulfurase